MRDRLKIDIPMREVISDFYSDFLKVKILTKICVKLFLAFSICFTNI
jgi:hypothetical protein